METSVLRSARDWAVAPPFLGNRVNEVFACADRAADVSKLVSHGRRRAWGPPFLPFPGRKGAQRGVDGHRLRSRKAKPHGPRRPSRPAAASHHPLQQPFVPLPPGDITPRLQRTELLCPPPALRQAPPSAAAGPDDPGHCGGGSLPSLPTLGGSCSRAAFPCPASYSLL